MIRLIDTNISLNPDNIIIDHQSRIIEIKDWDEFINDIKEGKSVFYKGTMDGFIIPTKTKYGIENLKYDKFHASFDIYLSKLGDHLGWKTTKLIYKIDK